MHKIKTGLVILAAVLAGCGIDGDDSNSAEPTGGVESASAANSICGLVTDEEISTILGNDVVGVGVDQTRCEYSLVEGFPATDGTAVDLFMNGASEESCALEFDLAGAAGHEAIDGVGNAAFWAPGSPIAHISVCTGESFLKITQYSPSGVTNHVALTRAMEISNLVVGRS